MVAEQDIGLGDEITHFNGEHIRTANQLATLVGVMPAYAWVSVGYRPQLTQRGYGKERTVYLRLAVLSTSTPGSSERRSSTRDTCSRSASSSTR